MNETNFSRKQTEQSQQLSGYLSVKAIFLQWSPILFPSGKIYGLQNLFRKVTCLQWTLFRLLLVALDIQIFDLSRLHVGTCFFKCQSRACAHIHIHQANMNAVGLLEKRLISHTSCKYLSNHHMCCWSVRIEFENCLSTETTYMYLSRRHEWS